MDFVKDSVFNQKFDTESELIEIKKYFNDFAEKIQPVERCQEAKCENISESRGCGQLNCKNDEFFKNFLGISQEQLMELKEVTSIDHIKCHGDENYFKNDDDTESDENDEDDEDDEDDGGDNKRLKKDSLEENQLISVQIRNERQKIPKLKFHRMYYKYCNYEWCLRSEREVKTKLDFDSISFPTILACIKIYHPFLSVKHKLIKMKLLQEIHVLGHQTLAQVKDKIICSFDYVGDEDISKDYLLLKDDFDINVSTKNKYPSSFMFIENVFYNDTRHPNSKDLSKVIREWAVERGLGTFECAKLENTKISDLNLKVGRPYLYQHQGNCEHIIVFSDIRFVDSSDPQQINCFPRTHCTGRIYGKHCMMCTDFYARWLVSGSDRLTHDKAYLCDNCFESYNYIGNKKVGNFEAFKYVDPIAML